MYPKIIYPKFDEDIFATNLVTLRKKYSLSQMALAKLTGCSVHYLRAIERGRAYCDLSMSIMMRMCQIFQVTYEELTVDYIQKPKKETAR